MEVPRCMLPVIPAGTKLELHVFADASELAIGSVAYLCSVTPDGEVRMSFISVLSKLAPRTATTIPRLELCAALLACPYALSVVKDLGITFDRTSLYSDSMVVLGYLRNTVKCSAKYITRRVEAILKSYPEKHWQYVGTSEKPCGSLYQAHISNRVERKHLVHGTALPGGWARAC